VPNLSRPYAEPYVRIFPSSRLFSNSGPVFFLSLRKQLRPMRGLLHFSSPRKPPLSPMVGFGTFVQSYSPPHTLSPPLFGQFFFEFCCLGVVIIRPSSPRVLSGSPFFDSIPPLDWRLLSFPSVMRNWHSFAPLLPLGQLFFPVLEIQ